MEPTVPWYQSAIIRQQIAAFILAAVGLFHVELGFDVNETLAAIFAGIGAAIPIWTIITRIFKPAPNLSVTAANKEAELKAKGVMPEPKASKSGGFAKLPMLIAILAGALVLGCAATQALKVAETPEQRAGALIGDFEVIQIAAKYVGSDQTVPADIRAKVLDAVIAAKPAVDQLDGLLRSYLQIETDLAAGTGTQAKLTIAAGKLSSWILEVAPKLSALQKLIKGAHS